VAATLNNLGILYGAEGETAASAGACNEAANILQQLAADNPDKFGPELRSVCTSQ
jgi:hypothetical protein